MKLIVLNGPPDCGKDTTADYLVESQGWHKFKLAHSLKLGAHALLGDSLDIMKYEGAAKNIPQEDLFGEIPREWYIYLSEEVLKPRFGKDILGKIAVRFLRILAPWEGKEGIVISDCGFMEELRPIIKAFGPSNIYVIQMFRDGCTYKADSRGYLDVAALTAWGCHVEMLHCEENELQINCTNLLELLTKEGFFNGT